MADLYLTTDEYYTMLEEGAFIKVPVFKPKHRPKKKGVYPEHIERYEIYLKVDERIQIFIKSELEDVL